MNSKEQSRESDAFDYLRRELDEYISSAYRVDMEAEINRCLDHAVKWSWGDLKDEFLKDSDQRIEIGFASFNLRDIMNMLADLYIADLIEEYIFSAYFQHGDAYIYSDDLYEIEGTLRDAWDE